MRTWQFLALTAAAALAAACGPKVVGGSAAAKGGTSSMPAAEAGKGSKTIKSETRTVESFERIQADGIFDLHVTVGSTLSVKVSADDNLLESVKTETRSKTLYVETNGDLHPSDPIRVDVVVPTLDEVRIAGAVATTIAGRAQDDTDFVAQASGTSSLDLPGVHTKKLDVALNGTTRLTAKDVACKSFHLVVNGAAQGKVAGATDSVHLDMDGTGKADLTALAAKDVTASLNGAATAEVNVSESLDARAHGASKLLYVGNPARLDKIAPPPNEVRPK